MSQCNRLFRIENAYAYHDSPQGQVTVVADVWLNPFTDHVHICPNPIAMPAGAPEFLVEGTTHRSGVHPEIIVKTRISFTFAATAATASVVVYSMGVDSPSRQVLTVLTAPPPAFQPSTAAPPAATTHAAPAAPAPAAPKASTTGAHGEVVGYSASFSFDEAMQDALAKAAALLPSPPRHPDAAITVEVTKIFAREKGNIQAGLYLTALAK
jgi:hypothetical protein